MAPGDVTRQTPNQLGNDRRLTGPVQVQAGGVHRAEHNPGRCITRVCPGPVDSEFDTVAGSGGGMTGGPPQFLRISAARCARDALAGFDRSKALVFPGRAYRLAMRLLPLPPRGLQRRQASRTAARVRGRSPAAATPAGPLNT